MAVVGFNVTSQEGIDDNANLTAAHEEHTLDYWPASASDMTQTDPTGHTDNLPVTFPSVNLTGIVANSYRDDYYYRVHILPTTLDLGPVVASQEHTIEVWSARFQTNDLTAINLTATDGLTLAGPFPPVTTFAQLESRGYTLSATSAGPARVDALFELVFDLDTAELTVTGNRVIAFLFPPDWNEPVVERMEWLTDVLTSFSGKEQRVQLRDLARFGIEYRVLLGGDFSRIALEHAFEAWQSRIFGVPLWYQAQALTAELAIGATTIPADTDEGELVVGELLAITRGTDGELLEIDTIGSGSVTTVTPTTITWPIGSKVMPARLARMVNDQSVSYLSDSIVVGRVRFEGSGEHAATPLSEGADYLGDPVYTTRTDWSNDVSVAHHRHLDELDNRVGLRAIDDRSGIATVTQSHSWLFGGRAAISAFREWLSARSGRLSAFWFPSHQNDVLVTSAIGSADTSITVENRGYARLVAEQVGRRDIMIWLHDGTRFYRRVTGSSESSDTVEVMEIDTSLGQNVAVADIRMVSFMRYSRLASDAVEISHETAGIARASVSFASLRDDTP